MIWKGNRADGAQGGVERGVFGGKRADGYAVAVGERVEGEFVGDVVVAADKLAEFEFVGGHGGRGELVAEGEMQRHALFQSLFERVGQLGVEAAADIELAGGGEHCAAAGGGDAFGGGFGRLEQQQNDCGRREQDAERFKAVFG